MRIGDKVIYIQGDQEAASNGTHEHPAIVTRVWGEGENPTVNLTVFFDNASPAPRSSTCHHSLRYRGVDDEGHEHHGPYYLHEHEHFAVTAEVVADAFTGEVG